MELLEIVGGLLTAIAGLIGAVTVALRLSAKQTERALLKAEKRTDQYIDEIKTDLKKANDELGKAQFRVKTLEDQRVKDLQALESSQIEIATLREQQRTVLTQMANLQAQVETLQKSLENEQRARERLEKKNTELEAQNARLFDANKTLQTENKTFREMMALLGMQLADSKNEKQSTMQSERTV